MLGFKGFASLGAAASLAGALVATPAFADVIAIGTFANATLTQAGSNVQVNVVATSGNSIKLEDSSDVFFNALVALTQNSFTDLASTPNVGTVSVDFLSSPTLNDVAFTFKADQNIGGGLGTFADDLTGIGTGDTRLQGITSANSIDFIVTGVTVAQLEGRNSGGFQFGAHICPESGTGTNCSSNTFFAAGNTTVTVPVPEPASLAIFGAALAGLGLIRRRRKNV
jgi:hypothetical protein